MADVNKKNKEEPKTPQTERARLPESPAKKEENEQVEKPAPQHIAAEQKEEPQMETADLAMRKKQAPAETLLPSKKKPAPQVALPKDTLTKQIETVLSEDLQNIYTSLPPIAKTKFRLQGEETVQKISVMFMRAHLSLRRLFALIFEWLKLLPGINRFFLEQEAKIKAEKIMALREAQKK